MPDEGQVTVTTGQVPQVSSALVSAVVPLHAVEPEQTRSTGSPVQLPMAVVQSVLVVPLVLLHPTVYERPAVHVKVRIVVQPHSRVVPEYVPVHGVVGLDVVEQLVDERIQVPAVLLHPVTVVEGPVLVPCTHRFTLEHHPHPAETRAAQVLQEVPVVAQGSAGHVPQSLGHVMHVSVPLHIVSPQRGSQGPQSLGQVVQVSVPLQVVSPQRGSQAPQSPGHVMHVSVPLHIVSPQRGSQAPQSPGHVMQVSVPLQMRSPQRGATGTSVVTGTSVGATSGITGTSSVTGPSRGGASSGGSASFPGGLSDDMPSLPVALSSVPLSSKPPLPPLPRGELHAAIVASAATPNHFEKRIEETLS